MDKKNLFRIIIAVILTNSAGMLLRVLKLDTYIILVGFRFHLIMVLPLLVMFRKKHIKLLKNVFSHPEYNKVWRQLMWIFVPLIIIIVVLFFTHNIDINDPDYFYEFGLSSIVDYPIYLVWNLPQLLLFSAFIIITFSEQRKSFWKTASMVLSFFVFEFVPLGKEKIELINAVTIILSIFSSVLIVKYFQNIYWLSIIIFTLFWECLLAFGSNSKMMINILFAARYHSWDGFFSVTDKIIPYLLPAQVLITVLLISVSSFAVKNKV